MAADVCVNTPGAPVAPLLLFGASVSYTVYLPNTRLCSENIYPAFRREMMQNSEVCFPLARGMPRSFPEPSLCGAWLLAWPLLSAQHRTFSDSHIGRGRTRGLAGNQDFSLFYKIVLFCLSCLFILDVLIFFFKSLLIFIILYHKNVFLQYLSCQFITEKCRDFISIGNTITAMFYFWTEFLFV